MIPLVKPRFWSSGAPPLARLLAVALWPLSLVYRAGYTLNRLFARPVSLDIPLICIGNAVAGGAGKTPCTLAIYHAVVQHGLAQNPVIFLKGYKAKLRGPLFIAPSQAAEYSADHIGDEAMMVARKGYPVILSHNRADGVAFAQAQGFDCIIMDDGLQNPSLRPDLSLCVVDAAYGFGNGFTLPAGPLREGIGSLNTRVDGYVVIGHSLGTPFAVATDKPVWQSALEVESDKIASPDTPILAFAGIARPQKFYDSLRQAGYVLADSVDFPDHYAYTRNDLDGLLQRAKNAGARLMTTEKDHARIADENMARKIGVLPVRLRFAAPPAHSAQPDFLAFLESAMARIRTNKNKHDNKRKEGVA